MNEDYSLGIVNGINKIGSVKSRAERVRERV